MQEKRGQVALFAILAVSVLLIFIVILSINDNLLNGFAVKSNFKDVNEANNALTSAVQGCIRTTGEQALKLVGIQGRAYPQNYFTYQNNKVYYAYKNQESLISIEELENEISTFINQNLKLCTNEIFEDYKKRGLVVDDKDVNTKTVISSQDVVLRINYGIEAKLNEKAISLSQFSEIFDVRLKKIHEISEQIVNSKDLVNLTYLDSLDVVTTIIPYPDNTIIFVLEDKNSRIIEQNYVYSFAVKK